jgi:hypothetical protein
MKRINAFAEGGIIYFQATNINEFKELIEQAEKQAQQLNDTIARLSNFKFKFKFEQTDE